ncbi:phospholipase-like protein [Tanacetum coccineum]|uniref:Phospholipase-like protein n=1 Tax=Tanacetum coccineum TaxID=301880 RepID=A0ABQ5HS20_9ASTR
MDLSDIEVPRVFVTCRNMDDWTENCILLHFMLGQQLELTGNENENIPLYYHIVDNFHIQFGREEFCLVSGLKFGVENSTDYNKAKDPIPFRRRVFSSDLDGGPIRGKDVELLIESDVFKKLDDNDVVSLCCVGILQLVLLGVEDRRAVPDWILRLARDGWDKYPWGRADEYYTRHKRHPRVVAWSSNGRFFRDMGHLPAERLTPDKIEARSGWWVSSRAFFDGRISVAERIPRHLNRENHYEVPSQYYHEYKEKN